MRLYVPFLDLGFMVNQSQIGTFISYFRLDVLRLTVSVLSSIAYRTFQFVDRTGPQSSSVVIYAIIDHFSCLISELVPQLPSFVIGG